MRKGFLNILLALFTAAEPLPGRLDDRFTSNTGRRKPSPQPWGSERRREHRGTF
jgi:hypothetical protein